MDLRRPLRVIKRLAWFDPPLSTYVVLRLTVAHSGWSRAIAAVGCICWALTRRRLAARRKAKYVSGDKALPTRKTADPVPAVKLAFPVVMNGRVLWHALVKPTTYEAEAAATCHVQDYLAGNGTLRRLMIYSGRLLSAEEHGPVPSLGCMCGFYALKGDHLRATPQRWLKAALTHWSRRRRKLDPAPVYAVLDVELLGKVIQFNRGYRAAHQRVMRAKLDGRCVICGRAAKGFYAGTFVVGPAGQAALVSTCGCQVPVRWDLQDVRNMAGTEIEWDRARQPLLTALRPNR